MNDQAAAAAGMARALSDPGLFSAAVLGRPLRPYQLDVVRAILRSVEEQAGRTITVMFPRHAGKNEASAQLEALLLARHSQVGGSLVKASPTFKPQTVNSIRRLVGLLDNPLTRARFTTPGGYAVQIGRALATFFSAAPTANVVGATANLLLECDEAQDVAPDKWSKDFLPMGSTGNATRVYWGTPWRDDDLLATSIEEARAAEARDGIRRNFAITWEDVARANPLYGRHVEAEIARLGEHHPIVQTQYLMRTLSGAGRFLSADQLAALASGIHPPEPAPSGPGPYVAGVDVAGADEKDPDGLILKANPKRDSTVLTIARAEQARADARVVEPHLAIVAIYAWIGTPHRSLYPTILDLIRTTWRCRSVVVDATGVGGGLAAFLGAALGPRVVTPYVYTAATKSALAYGLLEALNSRRLTLYAESADAQANAVRRELLDQAAAADYALRANQQMTFSVPEQRGHDDHLNALALVAQAARVGALRAAAARRPRPNAEAGPFGNPRPSRR